MAFVPNVEQWRVICEEASKSHMVPVNLLLAVIAHESAGRPKARSEFGALGLMQIVPWMHRDCMPQDMQNSPSHTVYGAHDGWWFDPANNIMCGARILASYNHTPDWDDDDMVVGVLASYVWGPGNVAAHPHVSDWPLSVQNYAKGCLKFYRDGGG